MATIDTSDPSVFSYTMTVGEARELLTDGTTSDDLDTVLDSAQSYVHGRQGLKSILVIEIIPDELDAA